jgi:hypothetical protein
MKYSGSCQCGTIQYSIDCEPLVAYCCHCTDCQKQSSSAFGISVWFPAAKFSLSSGELSIWKTRADSGRVKECAFCADCGSRIYHAFPDDPDIFSIKGGTLDKIDGIPPVGHIWTRSAQPWMRKSLDEKRCYETEPDTFDKMLSQFVNPTACA